LQKAIEIKPQWSDPYNALAQLYLAQRKSDVAIEKFRTALKANPKNPAAYLLLGQVYEGIKDFPNAIAVYEQGVANIPKFWVAENNLAFLLAEQSSKKSDLEKALLLAQNALKERPGEFGITDTMGWIYFKMGDTNQALGFMHTALEKAPDNPDINYHMGAILAKTGKTSEAKQYLQKALASNQKFYGKDDAAQLLSSLR
jgi:tetratricopeptide (TPR) repeat protein